MKQNLPTTTIPEMLIYQNEDGRIKLEVRFEDENIWLTQQLMAELFDSTKQNVGLHLKNVFNEGELHAGSVVKESFTTAADGKQYKTMLYNLDDLQSGVKLVAARRRKN